MVEKQTAKRNRREEILQSLALMLESSDGSQRITTAKLAASVGVSEAALYRHFPSKTRMFDSLIEFIEDSLITRINLILKDEKDTNARLRLIVLLILGSNFLSALKRSCARFCEKKECVKVKATPWMKRCWPASYWLSAKVCYPGLCVANLNTAQRMILTPAGRWLPLNCSSDFVLSGLRGYVGRTSAAPSGSS